MAQSNGHSGGNYLIAGPLPLDANPAVCTYEWTLNVRCYPPE